MKSAMTSKLLASPHSREKEAAIMRMDMCLRVARSHCIVRLVEFVENSCICPQLLTGAERAGLKCASSSLRPKFAT